VIGHVDSAGRALLRVEIAHPLSGIKMEVAAWIDTGFTGELVLPLQLIQQMNLPLGPAIRAGLADGSEVDLDTYTRGLTWFGQEHRIEVVANRGAFPLAGVGLLRDHVLTVDYRAKHVSLA
jgi:clan AA aspartic protease